MCFCFAQNFALLSNYLTPRIYCLNCPNDEWHCHGYDKILRQDFMIKSSRTKQRSYLSSGFVFKCDKGAGFMLRADLGFENGDIAAVHCFLKGGDLSRRCGASNANQRIENWWSNFKRLFSAWVKDYFKQLGPDDIFVPI